MKQGVHAENSDSNDDDDNGAYGDADFDFADNGDCSDYKYNPVNFLGLNICVLGSLIYTKVKFFLDMLLLFSKFQYQSDLVRFYKTSSQVTFTGKRQSVAPKIEKVQEPV